MGPLPFTLIWAFLLVMLWALDPILSGWPRWRGDPPRPGQSRRDSRQHQGMPLPPGNAARDWLPATLPAPPAVSPPWRPRVCAGRVATTGRYAAPAITPGRPAGGHLAGYGWPAPEGSAA